MAIQIAYTDDKTNSYSASYWRIANHTSDRSAKRMKFFLQGFKDASTAAAAKTNPAIKPIGGKTIFIQGDAFVAADNAIVAKAQSPYTIGYVAALADAAFSGGISV